jgi:RsiW-degrading membrane proteinase PrsW (M82 family)
MQALFSLVFAIVPMAVYLIVIWFMDRYDREPVGLLIMNFAWGAAGAILWGVVFSLVASAILHWGTYYDTVVLAPVVEECTKGLFLLITARNRRFDNITDGIVYGMAIGLGFGMTENFLYFLSAASIEQWIYIVLIRTFFSAILHAMATGTFGAFVGATKFGAPGTRVLLRCIGLVVAMFMHFVWNYAVSINTPEGFGLGALFIFLSVVTIMVLFQVSLLRESKLILRELKEEVEQGLIPPTHINYLPYTSKRKLIGWLSPIVDKKRYIKAATQLAFRKHQNRFLPPPGYGGEIEALRTEITVLLKQDSSSPASRLY